MNQKKYDETSSGFRRSVFDTLNSKISLGESKRAYKQSGASAQKLFSGNTIDAYKRVTDMYCRFIEAEHPDCRKKNGALKFGYAHDFIQQQIDSGKAASTIKLYTAALSAIHDVSMSDIHNDRPIVKSTEYTRSRSFSEEKFESQLDWRRDKHTAFDDNIADVMEICRMTGLREHEAEAVTPSNFFRDSESGDFRCHLSGNTNQRRLLHNNEAFVSTKGGRERTVEVLPRYNDRLAELLDKYAENPSEPILDGSNMPDTIDVHGIRSLYACELYNTYARKIEDISPHARMYENGRNVPQCYVQADGAKWDRVAVLRTSESLGHGRANVTVTSYLYRLK